MAKNPVEPIRGSCRRCGRETMLGENWQGRPSTRIPALWCRACEKSYPTAWTAEEIDDAVEQTTAFAYRQAERDDGLERVS